MSISPYRECKASGTAWLGSVPAHWSLRRLGYFFQERREKVSDKDFPALSVTKNGIVPQLETAAKTDDGDNRKGVMAGDFVINSRSDRKGSSGIAERNGSVSLINIVLTPLAEIQPRYVHHLLRSAAFQEEFYRFGKGIVADLWSTNYSDMKAITLAVPPLPEQAAIAAFLDRETAKIDALVAEQKRLIELLKEKRQAVISHAVTKGLNPNVPMKDMGIEWLGQVPEHWEFIPIKRLSSLITSGPRGWSEQAGDHGSIFFQSQNIGRLMETSFAECTRVTVDMTADAERAQLMADDVVVCITGARTSAVAHVTDLHETAFVNQHVCLVRPMHIQGRFLAYAIFSVSGQVQLHLAMYGLKQGLSLQDVRDVIVPVPPPAEATGIARQLDQFTIRIDLAMREAEQSITLLRERRAALISAAVTGKIDVSTVVEEEAA